jgi:hypothetical protein
MCGVFSVCLLVSHLVLKSVGTVWSFHVSFTTQAVVSNHPLEASLSARSPAGFFLSCDKTLGENAVQPSRAEGLPAYWLNAHPSSGADNQRIRTLFEVHVMRLTLPALVLGLLVAQGAMAASNGTAALGGGLGGALGNVVGQKLGGSTGATIGAGVAGAAGGAAGAHKGNRTKAAIGGGVGAAGGSVIGRSLGGKDGATIGAGLGGAAGGAVGNSMGKKGH